VNPLVTLRGLKIRGAIILVGIVTVVVYKHFVPYTYDKQSGKNYAGAERHILILKPLIEKDRRFSRSRFLRLPDKAVVCP